MSKNPLLFLFCVTIILGSSHSYSQALSGSSLTISGTGAINTLVSSTASITSGSIGSLVVGGTTDLLGNTLYFGSWTTDSSKPGWSLFYDDGISGTNSSLTQVLTRPQAIWNWQRVAASGGASNVMQLDASNRLILTGTDPNNAQQLILDPNGGAALNSVLTLQLADSRYVSSANISEGTDSWGWGSPVISILGGQATGPYSFAGIQAHASGIFANAVGLWSTVSGNYSTALAQGAVASGDWATASGNDATASGQASTASGCGSLASGQDSTASGHNATAAGIRSIASGFIAIANGESSLASGDASTANGWGSMSGGYMTITEGCFQTAVGIRNVPQGDPQNWNPTDPLFIIGNGTFSCDPMNGNPLYDQNGNPLQDIQSNALVIYKNGDTTVYGAFTIGGTSSNVNSIVNGGLVVTGTAVQVVTETGTGTKIVASGTNQLVLIPEQGDLSMGNFIHGAPPVTTASSQTFQQSPQNSISAQNFAGIQGSVSQARAGRALASGGSAFSGTASMASGTASAQ